MIKLDEYADEDRQALFEMWIETDLGDILLIDHDDLFNLFEADYEGINHGSDQATRGPIMRFGPMHYRDVTAFLQESLQDKDLYIDDPDEAVGQAFRTFIVPRLLNSAAFPQIEQIRVFHHPVSGFSQRYISGTTEAQLVLRCSLYAPSVTFAAVRRDVHYIRPKTQGR